MENKPRMVRRKPNNEVIPKENKFVSKLSEQILDFWNYGLYTDVTFAWKWSGQRVKAHQIVLAASSVYFQTLFKVIPGEKKLIYIDSIYSSTFHELIKYCYTGELHLNAFNVVNLLKGAKILKLKGAIGICTRYMLGTQRELDLCKANPPTATDTNNTSPDIPYVAGKRNDNIQWPSLSRCKGLSVSTDRIENVGTPKQWGPPSFQKEPSTPPKIPSAFSSFTFSPSISKDIRNMFSSNETLSSNSSKDSISPTNFGDKFVANIESSLRTAKIYEEIAKVEKLWAY